MTSASCCERLIAARTERDVAGLRVVAAAAHAGHYVEDASSLVSRVGDSADWDALFLCVEMEGRVLVVARSRTPALSVDEASRRSAAAGMPQAASALVREEDPEAVLERVLLEAARVAEEPPPRASGDVAAGSRGRERATASRRRWSSASGWG